MKKILFIIAAIALYGNTYSQKEYTDDLYAPPVKNARERQKPRYKDDAINNYDTRSYNLTYDEYRKTGGATAQSNANISGELVTNIDDALRRRIEAMNNPQADYSDDKYRSLMEAYAASLEKRYDSDLYNVIWLNDKIWVEPKYITAVFSGDTDFSTSVAKYLNKAKKQATSTTQNTTNVYNINIYNRPYDYGWNVSFGYGYYGNSWWHGGYNPWYNPWNPWQNPWYGPHYGPWYNPWYSPWYNPWYRPIYVPVNTRPIYHGNGYNGNRYYNGNNGYGQPAPSARPNYNDGRRNNNYDQGLGRPTNRPENNSRPTTEPQRPTSNPNPPASQGGGFQDMGGSRRR